MKNGIRLPVLIVLLVLTACTEPTEAGDLFDIETSVAVACSSVDDWLETLPAESTLVLGVVALPGSDNAPNALQVSRGGDTGWYGTKSGLIVPNGGRAFTLSVPQDLRDRMFIWDWGNNGFNWEPGGFKWETRAPGCERTEAWVDEWLIFGGSLSIREPECVSLVVSDGSSEERVMIGVGAPCPGQNPPLEPIDIEDSP